MRLSSANRSSVHANCKHPRPTLSCNSTLKRAGMYRRDNQITSKEVQNKLYVDHGLKTRDARNIIRGTIGAALMKLRPVNFRQRLGEQGGGRHRGEAAATARAAAAPGPAAAPVPHPRHRALILIKFHTKNGFVLQPGLRLRSV
ncbi:unnamed protein product [Amoebophrya sp. A120]|nr:unnamed protein product [Amoebophrya sp. A120]|eukprot:GSA120T00023017001.1